MIVLATLIITRKRGNCEALQLEASRSTAWLRPPSGKIAMPKNCTWSCLNVCKISAFYSYSSFRDMTKSQIFTSGAAHFCPPPLRNVGANWEISHGSLFTAATTPIGGMTYWRRCTRRGPVERGIYQKFSTFTFFEVPIAPTVLGVGGTKLSYVWWDDRPITGPCQVCFWFPIKCRLSKIRRSKVDWSRNLG